MMMKYSPETKPYLHIIYQDKDIIVLNKPNGLLSVPGRKKEHKDSILERVKYEYPIAYDVHRLDMATSGLIIVALRKSAERELKKQFREKTIQKTYYAEVHGHLTEKKNRINLPLTVDWVQRPKQKICFDTGKAATTEYEVVKEKKHSSIVKLSPITGRTHQLRLHMAAIGHPILGDHFYAPQNIQRLSSYLRLHAYAISIKHPYFQHSLSLYTPCPFYSI